MMIYWIIFLIILVLWLVGVCIYLFLTLQRIKKLNTTLTQEVVETKKAPIIIGKITKYKEEELTLLLSNPEVITLLMDIFEYKIAVKTDTIRSLEDTDRKVWYLDCLHETHSYFYQLKKKLSKKEDKIWQSLV